MAAFGDGVALLAEGAAFAAGAVLAAWGDHAQCTGFAWAIGVAGAGAETPGDAIAEVVAQEAGFAWGAVLSLVELGAVQDSGQGGVASLPLLDRQDTIGASGVGVWRDTFRAVAGFDAGEAGGAGILFSTAEIAAIEDLVGDRAVDTGVTTSNDALSTEAVVFAGASWSAWVVWVAVLSYSNGRDAAVSADLELSWTADFGGAARRGDDGWGGVASSVAC